MSVQPVSMNLQRQSKFIYELETVGLCSLERWSQHAKGISNYYMLGALLNANIKGYGRVSGIPEHLLEANLKHGPIALYQLIKNQGYKPSRVLINQVLSNELWIRTYHISYDKLLQVIYISNEIMLRKWKRYAEGVRSL